MRRVLLGLSLAVGLLVAGELQAGSCPAFSTTAGLKQNSVGGGPGCNVVGRVSSLYIVGETGGVSTTFRVECSETNSTTDADWAPCSETFTLSGTTKRAFTIVKPADWVRAYIITDPGGYVLGTFTWSDK